MGMAKFQQRIVAPQQEQWTPIITVTVAQILALFTTPVTLVAARPNYVNKFEGAYIVKPAGTAYTVGTATDISIKYTNAAGLAVGAIAPAGFADSAAEQKRVIEAYRTASGSSAVAAGTNAPLVLSQATANMTAGNSPFKIRVYYRQLPANL